MPRTRFAPSPTGYLHLGHAFSAQYAKEKSGFSEFLLRIEDIDAERSRAKYVDAIYKDLLWLGLKWDGEVVFQSERREHYESALDSLKKLGLIYPCFCTRKEIQNEINQMVHAPHGRDGFLYPGTCRSMSENETLERIKRGMEHCWRLDVCKASGLVDEISWIEKGEKVIGNPVELGDVVLARKDSGLSYHLCCVVDDEEQGIELVTRGLDLMESTSIQVLLQRVLGYSQPEYSHHQLVVDEDGKRLAKRSDSVSVRHLRELGLSVDEVWSRLVFSR